MLTFFARKSGLIRDTFCIRFFHSSRFQKTTTFSTFSLYICDDTLVTTRIIDNVPTFHGQQSSRSRNSQDTSCCNH